MKLLRMMMIVLSSSLLVGCGGGLPPEGGSDIPADDWTGTTAYIPFVEEVTIQDPIYAGEDFTVTLRVSSELFPELLAGTTARRGPLLAPGPFLAGVGHSGWVIDTWTRAPADPSLPPNDQWDFTLGGLPAGEWVVAVWQLQERLHGGKAGIYQLTPTTGAMDKSGLDLVFYPITVIERPTP